MISDGDERKLACNSVISTGDTRTAVVMPADRARHRCRPSRPSQVALVAVMMSCMLYTAHVFLRGATEQDRARSEPTQRHVEKDVVNVFHDAELSGLLHPDHREALRRVIDWAVTLSGVCHHLTTIGDATLCFDSLPSNVQAKAVGTNDLSTEGGTKRSSERTADGAAGTTAGGDGCLVYTLGVSSDWSLETELARRGCEVHVFEAAVPEPPELKRSGVHFHRLPMTDNYVRPADLIQDNGHWGRRIHVLHINAGVVFLEMLNYQLLTSLDKFALDQFDQIAGVIELPRDPHAQPSEALSQQLHFKHAIPKLEEVGFRLVFSIGLGERRYRYPGVDRITYAQYYVVLVRSGRDIFDRMQRNAKDMPNIFASNS